MNSDAQVFEPPLCPALAAVEGAAASPPSTSAAPTSSQIEAPNRLLFPFLQSVPASVAMFDADMRYLFASQRWLAEYKLDEDIVGKSHYDIFPDLKEGWREIHQRGLAGESICCDEERWVRADGSVLWIRWEVQPWRDDDGAVGGIVIFAETTAGRKYTAEQLRRLIAENSTDAIFAWDMQRRLIYANPAIERLTGYSLDELYQSSFVDWVHPDDKRRLAELRDRLFAGESYDGVEFRLITKSGETRWCMSTCGPLYDENGQQIGVQGRDHDITERKRLEAQLIQAQKMESIGRLAGGVAHDFNNLLTAISGYASLAAADLDPSSAICGDLQEIQKATQRASQLTRQLLGFAGRSVVDPRALSLHDLVLDMDKLLRRVIGEDIELVTLTAPAAGLVRADPGQIEQVLVNLAINARDAMPAGGKLTIATDEITLDRAGAGGQAPGAYVRLTVSDTGVGMSEEIQSHAFEPFFTTKTSGKGTGLGLAICYGIVTQASGHLEFESTPGQGTTFRIYLPRIADGEQEGAPHDGAAVAPRGSETILLAEDEPAVRALGARVLRAHGYAVLEAANGVEALRIAREHPGAIALLLSDVVMPQIGGEALAEQFRLLYPATKILFTSGYTDSASFRSSVVEHGAAFIAKPFLPAALVLKVRETLDS